jgi:uncharacterized protein YeaO (DUF488 family)
MTRRIPMPERIPARRIGLKRAYLPAAPTDGMRILVDRLWPRGVRKSDAAIDLWVKNVAPSTALRQWFGHDLARWPKFRRLYAAELRGHPDELAELRAAARRQTVTLVFAARDERHNDAVVLRNVLLGRQARADGPACR